MERKKVIRRNKDKSYFGITRGRALGRRSNAPPNRKLIDEHEDEMG